MLRALLIYLSQAGWARRLVTGWPVAWRVSSRFVAGETLEAAIPVIKQLNQEGLHTTLDHLGEYTHTEQEAKTATEAIIRAIAAIDQEGLQSGMSIKLTQIGLAVDFGLCAENLAFILGFANQRGLFVRLDMEDASFVDDTLTLYWFMRGELGCENVGVVMQAYLYRAGQDTQTLADEGVRIRLTKGAYQEPPEIAYPRKKDVDANFDRLTSRMIAGAVAHGAEPASGRRPPLVAIATHDEKRIAYAKTAAAKAGLPQAALEFQMLFGIRRELQDQLVAEGYPVRVYVPYGRQWYPYFMRRLAERPANLWFFLSNFVRR